MSRIAIVGAGISGLAAAWLLSRKHDVLLFERDDRLGGHTHTHHLDTPDGALALDTGFLVHNDRTYPLLARLFAELDVPCRDAEMSFGVSCRRTGFEYSTRDLNGLFAQRSNLVRPGHYRLLADIVRLNRRLRTLVLASDATRSAPDETLGAFLERHGLHGEVVERFLLPLAAAIWSSPPADILRFPVLTLARFVHQHGMDTLLDHPTWKVIAGGSATYVPKLLQASTIAVHLRAAPQAVRRSADGVVLTFVDRPSVTADEVIFACHGDEVLPMLEDPSPEEQTVLGAFQTTHNTAALHTDSRWLPRRAAARAAWNYALDPSSGAATVTYHLNRLQGLEATRDYCVTLNPTTPIEPYHLLRTMHYRHPLYTTAAVASQQRWTEISGHRRTHYCGAYWFYGFHEDGLRSAVRVASMLGVRW